MEKNVNYIFVLVPKKRKSQNIKYDGILRYYNYWIYYYFMLPGQDPIEVVKTREPILVFPVQHMYEIEQFAFELGGTKVGEMRKPLKAVNREITLNVIGFEILERYIRHLAFALLAAVEGSKTKMELLKAGVLESNIGFLKVFAFAAEDIYKEKKDSKRILKIARALKLVLEAFEK